jgi:hypothetical protein
MNATILAAVAAIPVLLYFASGFFFYRMAVARTPKKFMDTDPALPDTVNENGEEVRAWWDAQDKREERIRSFDGIELVGDYLPSPEPTDLAVILVHGYTGTGPTMKRYARLFRDRFSCDILTPDLRGHGRSGGAYIGFGLPDSRDLLSWMDRLSALRGRNIRFVLFGVSMGAATVIQASAAEAASSEAVAGNDLSCVVADCGFTSAAEILAYKLKKLYGLPSFPFLGAVVLLTRRLAGYDLRRASALAAAPRVSAPLLVIHGDQDAFVPPEMASRIHGAAGSRRKELYLVPGAGHAESFHVAGDEYAERVAAFVRSALTPSS